MSKYIANISYNYADKNTIMFDIALLTRISSYTSESNVYRCQILMCKDGPRAERVIATCLHYTRNLDYGTVTQ